jgi:hypothetical protein
MTGMDIPGYARLGPLRYLLAFVPVVSTQYARRALVAAILPAA